MNPIILLLQQMKHRIIQQQIITHMSSLLFLCSKNVHNIILERRQHRNKYTRNTFNHSFSGLREVRWLSYIFFVAVSFRDFWMQIKRFCLESNAHGFFLTRVFMNDKNWTSTRQETNMLFVINKKSFSKRNLGIIFHWHMLLSPFRFYMQDDTGKMTLENKTGHLFMLFFSEMSILTIERTLNMRFQLIIISCEYIRDVNTGDRLILKY